MTPLGRSVAALHRGIVRCAPAGRQVALAMALLATNAFGASGVGDARGPLVDASLGFTLDLFRLAAEREPETNIVLSPLSVYVATGMTANGADGDTLAAMRKTLGQSALAEDQINDAYEWLVDEASAGGEGVEISMANSLWYRNDDGFEAHPSFLELNRKVFGAEIEPLDFDDPVAPSVVNAWVAEATHDKIPGILGEIRPDDVMFIINAVYFKGIWSEPFPAANTEPVAFHRADGATVSVPTMRNDLETPWAQFADGLQVVELPYGTGSYSMVLVLPPPGASPVEVLAGATASDWHRWVDALQVGRLAIDLPRFKIEYETLLNDSLTVLGMGIVFSDGADFTRLGRSVLPIAVSEVRQKAMIEVDEEGSVATAATVERVIVTSAPPRVQFNRPFLFAIREASAGAVLFIGQVQDPSLGS